MYLLSPYFRLFHNIRAGKNLPSVQSFINNTCVCVGGCPKLAIQLSMTNEWNYKMAQNCYSCTYHTIYISSIGSWWTIRICCLHKSRILLLSLHSSQIHLQVPNMAMDSDSMQICTQTITLQMHCECICSMHKFFVVCHASNTYIMAVPSWDLSHNRLITCYSCLQYRRCDMEIFHFWAHFVKLT